MSKEFETAILRAISELDENAYGVTIAEKMEEHDGKRVSIGSLYTYFKKLEEEALIEARLGEATEERGGRPKKYYRIKEAGLKFLSETTLPENGTGSLNPAWQC